MSGGVSNISFSFRGNNRVREAMHAAFLYHAIRAGMDMGIVNAGMLEVYEEIPTELRELIEDVLLEPPPRRDRAAGRLRRAPEGRERRPGRRREAARTSGARGTVEERLSHALVKGIDTYIDARHRGGARRSWGGRCWSSKGR